MALQLKSDTTFVVLMIFRTEHSQFRIARKSMETRNTSRSAEGEINLQAFTKPSTRTQHRQADRMKARASECNSDESMTTTILRIVHKMLIISKPKMMMLLLLVVRCRWKMTRTNPFNEKVANTETVEKRLMEKEREVKLY